MKFYISEVQTMLKPGDTIECANKEDCINTMTELAKCGVETDFLYEKRRKARIVTCCYEN